MTVKLIPSFANNSRDADGTAVSPEDQLFPENRGISFPSARCSVCWSGNRMRMCMNKILTGGSRVKQAFSSSPRSAPPK